MGRASSFGSEGPRFESRQKLLHPLVQNYSTDHKKILHWGLRRNVLHFCRKKERQFFQLPMFFIWSWKHVFGSVYLLSEQCFRRICDIITGNRRKRLLIVDVVLDFSFSMFSSPHRLAWRRTWKLTQSAAAARPGWSVSAQVGAARASYTIELCGRSGSAQCCRSWMFIPDLIFIHPGSRIQRLHQKRRGEKNFCPSIFCSHKYHKIVNNLIFEQAKKIVKSKIMA